MKRRPNKLQINVQDLDLDQIVSNLERMIIDTEKKVERIISRGPTPRNLKTTYQKNVPDANGRRIEDIRKTLRGARKSLHVLLRRQRGLVKEVKISPKKKKEYCTIGIQTDDDLEQQKMTISTTTQTKVRLVTSTPTQTIKRRKPAIGRKENSSSSNNRKTKKTIIYNNNNTMKKKIIMPNASIISPSTTTTNNNNYTMSNHQKIMLKTPPTKKRVARTWKAKALLKIRKALYKKILKDAPHTDIVFYNEYEKVNQNLIELGIPSKQLPMHYRTNQPSKQLPMHYRTNQPPSVNQIEQQHDDGKVPFPSHVGIIHTKQNNLASIEEEFKKSKSLEYLFAKILAGPISPSSTRTRTTTATKNNRNDLVQDIDEDVDDHIHRMVNISSSSTSSSILDMHDFNNNNYTHDLPTPPHTPNRRTLFITKTPPSSGRKRNRFYPLSKSPKAKRIFNPVSPILKSKGDDDDVTAMLFQNIDF